ncbi:XdhC-like protein [Crenobacter luteus]|uniref:XdhC family protein n=1 Tax=Crenobacter luteus TaxID=1452487 RepID=UPI00104EFE0D|nr:XdhC family protein [Crenobacter luteus]TCP12127.1 XdhC-like protein [Crenobacter luteus]
MPASDPAWRLILVGAGQVSEHLARIAPALDFAVLLNEPREDRRAAWPLAGSDWLAGAPDEAVHNARPDARTAVLALTHVPELDDAALAAALETGAFYVGAIGSRANAAARRARLAARGVDATRLDRLCAPIGLAIGSRTPAEIAVSILAELIQQRRRHDDAADAPRCVAGQS